MSGLEANEIIGRKLKIWVIHFYLHKASANILAHLPNRSCHDVCGVFRNGKFYCSLANYRLQFKRIFRIEDHSSIFGFTNSTEGEVVRLAERHEEKVFSLVFHSLNKDTVACHIWVTHAYSKIVPASVAEHGSPLCVTPKNDHFCGRIRAVSSIQRGVPF